MLDSKAEFTKTLSAHIRNLLLQSFRNVTKRQAIGKMLQDQSGQALVWSAMLMTLFLGFSAATVDVGRAMIAQKQLQASADAAALAAAQTLPNTNYQTVGTTYSSGSGYKNAYSSLSNVNTTFTGKCLTTVSGWGVPCTSSNPNAVQVSQKVSIPTYFGFIFGINTMNLQAISTASARGANPLPYNVAIVVDSTLSMDTIDSNCGGITQMACALNGVQQLLTDLFPSVDQVSLFTFPNVSINSTAGVAYSGNYTCTTSFPSNQGYNHSSTFGYYSMLNDAPWTGAAWAMPYTFPPIPTSTSGYTVPTGTNAPTYQVVPFSNDYKSSNTATSLVSSSKLVKAAGGVSGCGGIQPSNYDGDYGTYYAGAIYAAQAALLNEQKNYPGTQNVMVVLGDGNSTAPSASSSPYSSSPAMPSTSTQSTTTYSSSGSSHITTSGYTFPASYKLATSGGSYPSWVGECGQAVDAAQYAATYTNNATQMFVIAYGASTSSNSSNCGSDRGAGNHPNISPCNTLKQMASDSAHFYSDYYAPGGDSGCQASGPNQTITSLNTIFGAIAAQLTSVRLIPNNTP